MFEFVKKHPAVCFIALAFGWSWAWWLPVAGTDMSDLSKIGPSFFVFAMIGGLGPSLAGLVIRFILPRAERPRLVARPKPILFLFALLPVPAAALATLWICRLLGLPSDTGDIASRLAIGLVWPLMSAMGEEFGWRGILLPLWNRKCGFWKPAVGIGLLWGLWHLPSDWIALGHLGWWFVPQFVLVGLVNLTLLSIMMNAILRQGGGDIRLAILFHYSVTASAILFGAQGRYGPRSSVAAAGLSQLILAAVCLAVVFIRSRIRISSAPQA